MNALVAQDITKQYANHTALDKVSVTIPEQSIFGLLGPNGAGKTTLIRIINQIITADSGEIRIYDKRLTSDHIGTIGYLPEERGLYKKLKVGEQLLYLARLRGLSRADALSRIKYWLEKFEIKDWANKKVEDLSKGMAQKIQFISTILHEPKLIILDEPFSGFDPINAQLITDEILELKKKGSTIIFSTHRMETVEDLCDHIMLINRAKNILEGPKKQVKEKFKTKAYIVEHKGPSISLLNGHQLLKQETLEDDLQRSLIKTDSTPNQLLRDLLEMTEVHSFIEQVPSMGDIFISLVKGANHE